MNSKQKKVQQKRDYERIKDIENRFLLGESTTFQERQAMYIYKKRMSKKKL